MVEHRRLAAAAVAAGSVAVVDDVAVVAAVADIAAVAAVAAVGSIVAAVVTLALTLAVEDFAGPSHRNSHSSEIEVDRGTTGRLPWP